MEISVRDDGNVTIISPAGDFGIGQAESAFKRETSRLVENGRVNILVDCRKLGTVDSCGLGTLVRTLTTTHNEGGETKLLAPNPNLLKLLQMTQLDSVFEIFDDLEKAVASF